jgi:hypothetical protein
LLAWTAIAIAYLISSALLPSGFLRRKEQKKKTNRYNLMVMEELESFEI